MVYSEELMGTANWSIKNTFFHFTADSSPARACERSQSVPALDRNSREASELQLIPIASKNRSGFAICESRPLAAADETQCDWGEMVSPWADQHENPSSEIAMAGESSTDICHDPMMWPQAKQARDRQVSESTSASEDDGQFLTAMIKNIPSRCTCQDVIDAIDSLGFGGIYNFFYLPIRCRKEMKGFGFAFIGFPDAYLMQQFQAAMTGYRFTSRNSPKVVDIVRARIQGLDNCLAHFKSTRTLNSRQSPIFVNNGDHGLCQVV